MGAITRTLGLSLLLSTVACGSENSESPGEAASGGAGAENEGNGGTGGSDASSETCKAEQEPVLLATLNGLTDEFTVHGDSVFVVDSATPDNGVADRIRRLALDGSEDEIVHIVEVTLFDFLHFSLALDDTYVYYAHAPGVMRVPQTGGEAEQVSLAETDFSAADTILHADGEFVYTTQDLVSLLRISVEDGSETILAEHDDRLYDPQVFDRHIWYRVGFLPGGVYNTPLAANDASEAMQSSTAPCSLYRMSVTDDGIICSNAFSLVRYGLDDEERTTLLEFDESGGLHASAPDGERIYLYPLEGASDRTIYALPSAGGNPVPITCAKDTVLKLSFNEDTLVWLELAIESVDTETISLYTARK